MLRNNLFGYLQRSADKFPDKTAIIDEYRRASFIELKLSAMAIGLHLQQLGIRNNTPIAVLLPKSINAIEAFLGVLFHRCFYMPLDVNNPAARLLLILQKVDPSAIITSKKHMNLLTGIKKSCNIILIEDIPKHSEGSGEVYQGGIDTDPAYLICTSGSTGGAKAVAIAHKSVINYIDWAIETYKVNSKTIIGSQAPLVFDNSVLDIYLCLATSCMLVLIPDKLFAFPVKLIDYISTRKVNFIFWVPSIMANVMAMDLLKEHKLSLNKILFAGEQMPTKVLNYWREHIPNALFSNLYGPTEITVDCTYYIVSKRLKNTEPVPIGTACNNTDILLINDEDKLISSAQITGELCVRGICLALGYYNDSEKTANAFVQNPTHNNYPEKIYRTGDLAYYNENMELIYVGRKDFQIKHYGYRIDPGEIEVASMSLDAIEIACVLYNEAEQHIILLYQSQKELTYSTINSHLIKLIPKYMLPKECIYVKKMLLSNNGKIDRLALKHKYV